MRRIALGLCAISVVSAGLALAFIRLAPIEFSNVSAHDPRVILGISRDIRHLQIDAQCGAVRYSRAFLECGGVCGARISLHLPLRAAPDLPILQAQSRADDILYWPEGTPDSCMPGQIDLIFDKRLR